MTKKGNINIIGTIIEDNGGNGITSDNSNVTLTNVTSRRNKGYAIETTDKTNLNILGGIFSRNQKGGIRAKSYTFSYIPRIVTWIATGLGIAASIVALIRFYIDKIH